MIRMGVLRRCEDGRTHLARKAEHAVDLETGAVVGVTVQGADTGDTISLAETVIAAAEQIEAVQPNGPGIEEVADDKGYHSDETLADLKALRLGSYIFKPDRGRRCWKGQPTVRDAVYANRIGSGFAGAAVVPSTSATRQVYRTPYTRSDGPHLRRRRCRPGRRTDGALAAVAAFRRLIGADPARVSPPTPCTSSTGRSSSRTSRGCCTTG